MKRSLRRWLWVALVCTVAGPAATSCLEPTAARAVISSDVAWAAGRRISIATGSPETIGTRDPVAVVDTWEAPAVGDIVIVPSGERDSAVAIRVVMGVAADPGECSDAKPEGCIISRRRLSYVPRKELRVPIRLWKRCIGVACDKDSTCNALGQCVSATIDPAKCGTPAGCEIEGDPTTTEITPDAGGDAALDAGPDAPADSAVDGSVGTSEIELVAGTSATCARHRPTGRVKCWGLVDYGSLGYGANGQSLGDEPNELASVPDLAFGAPVTSISFGSSTGCAVLPGSNLRCWGLDNVSQLGMGTNVPGLANPITAVPVGQGGLPIEVFAAYWHTCVTLSANGLPPSLGFKCWGANFALETGQPSHQLGVMDGGAKVQARVNDPATSFARIDEPGIRKIVGGQSFSCALLANGSVKCWGSNFTGALASGTPQARDYAGAFLIDPSPRKVVELEAGLRAACARLDDGAVRCWGIGGMNGTSATLGDGETWSMIGDLPLGAKAVRLARSSGHSGHLCAILEDGKLVCWGNNESGQLGLGDLNRRVDGPYPRTPLTGRVQDVAVGLQHTCAVVDDRCIKCWGLSTSYGNTQTLGGLPNEVANLPCVDIKF